MVGYLSAMWRCRYFWMSLVKIDLRTRYRRSVIGLGWSLLRPLLMTTIMCLVFRRIFDRRSAIFLAHFSNHFPHDFSFFPCARRAPSNSHSAWSVHPQLLVRNM